MDVIFNSFKIKFEDLNNLLRYKEITKKDSIDIYINLESCVRMLSNKVQNERLKAKPYILEEFVSQTINLASHYRLFFNKKNINNRIFIYIQNPEDLYLLQNRMINDMYRKHFEYMMTSCNNNFHVARMVKESISMLQTICEYITGVYFICAKDIESSLVPYILKNKFGAKHSFIVTTDIYEFQYVNLGFDIIFPKTGMKRLINKDNVIQTMCELNKYDGEVLICNNQVDFLLSLIGNVYRNILTIKGIGFTKAIKILNSAMKKGIIDSSTNNIMLLTASLKENYMNTIVSNFYNTSIKYQYDFIYIDKLYAIYNLIVDRFDVDSLKKLNDDLFTHHPINIEEVTTQYKSKKLIW